MSLKEEIRELIHNSECENVKFEAIPHGSKNIAKTLSSFANTNGGYLIFGIIGKTPTNDIVGLSRDFNIEDITDKAIKLLSPSPIGIYEYVKIVETTLFVIKIDKSEDDIIFEDFKYIRIGKKIVKKEELNTLVMVNGRSLSISGYNRTIAIIIAIEDYTPREQNQVDSVKYAENDANLFKTLLIEQMSVSCENIYTFINEGALYSTLKYSLKSLFHYLTENDRLIFYYVGHGFHNGVQNYISTYDMHPEHIQETAIPLREVLFDPISESKCKSSLVFIDACSSSVSNENGRNIVSNLDNEEFTLLSSKHSYSAIFLSCQPGQSSYSSDSLKQGIWTHHLAQAISGNVPRIIIGDKFITDRSLTDYLSSSVASFTKKELNYDQNPKSILDSERETIIVGFEREKA